ncbi:hypothetical protein C8F01DRAFT_508697 [Mycena amicta]|nr:hypothetical protein C8F01DRAFT_508697 [Mycena amicta]
MMCLCFGLRVVREEGKMHMATLWIMGVALNRTLGADGEESGKAYSVVGAHYLLLSKESAFDMSLDRRRPLSSSSTIHSPSDLSSSTSVTKCQRRSSSSDRLALAIPWIRGIAKRLAGASSYHHHDNTRLAPVSCYGPGTVGVIGLETGIVLSASSTLAAGA